VKLRFSVGLSDGGGGGGGGWLVAWWGCYCMGRLIPRGGEFVEEALRDAWRSCHVVGHGA